LKIRQALAALNFLIWKIDARVLKSRH